MENSKHIAGLLGPSIIAVTISEALNAHIWVTNIAPVIHFNGAVLFIAGLAIVRAHNHWIRSWTVIVTLVGWFVMLLGLFRMFAPELYLQNVRSTSTMMAIASAMMLCPIGIYLTFKAYRREDSKTAVHPE
jgi:hypothetical protein